MRDAITFVQGDGLTALRENAQHPNAAFFIDPPYTAAGKRAGLRLYVYHELNHESLFDIAVTLRGDFLMTYDNCQGVRALAEKHGLDVAAVAMKSTITLR